MIYDPISDSVFDTSQFDALFVLSFQPALH